MSDLKTIKWILEVVNQEKIKSSYQFCIDYYLSFWGAGLQNRITKKPLVIHVLDPNHIMCFGYAMQDSGRTYK